MTAPEITALALSGAILLLIAASGALVYLLVQTSSSRSLSTPTPLPLYRPTPVPETRYRSFTPSYLHTFSPPTTQPRLQPSVQTQPASALAAILAIRNGPLQGQNFALSRPSLSLGRGARCDIVIPDPYASRQHARLEWRNDGLYLVDANSTNGTFVNNRRIKQHRLRGGEQVQISNTILTIHLYK